MIVISERINGLFRSVGKAVDKRDAAFVQDLARKQVACGASILDINTGPGRDDAEEVMRWMVETVQDAVGAQLSIDAPKPKVIEAGIKAAKDRVLINSTTAEMAKMESLFPLAKEYGSDIICLCLNEQGIPNDAASRCEMAMVMLTKAMEYDIGTERIFLDPLAMPVGAAQDQGPKVLEALTMFKQLSSPPPKTTVGLSNVSNNTTQRPILNRTYLVMMMAHGLDSAIMDPMDPELIAAAKTADILMNRKLYAHDFLKV